MSNLRNVCCALAKILYHKFLKLICAQACGVNIFTTQLSGTNSNRADNVALGINLNSNLNSSRSCTHLNSTSLCFTPNAHNIIICWVGNAALNHVANHCKSNTNGGDNRSILSNAERVAHGLCQMWHYRRSSAATANVNGCARIHAIVFHKLFCHSAVLLCGECKNLSCCFFNAHAHILCKRSPCRTSSFNRTARIITLGNKACNICSASHGQTDAKTTITLNSCVFRVSIHRTNSN